MHDIKLNINFSNGDDKIIQIGFNDKNFLI
jgi:hypothetical protein